MLSDRELPVSELGSDFELGFVFMIDGLLRFVVFVIVCGRAVVISRSHFNQTTVLARTAAISGNSSGPTFAIAGGGPVSVLQGLVFEIGV